MSSSSKPGNYKVLYIVSMVILIASIIAMFANWDIIYFHNIVKAYIAQEPPHIIGRKIIYTVCMIIVITSSYLSGIILLIAGMQQKRRLKRSEINKT